MDTSIVQRRALSNAISSALLTLTQSTRVDLELRDGASLTAPAVRCLGPVCPSIHDKDRCTYTYAIESRSRP
jgi:hypothetical protein